MERLTDAIECAVCLEMLDANSRVLPCQHTFCHDCLHEIVASKGHLRCPECRILVEAPVDSLPTNILLIRLLESLKLNPNKPKRAPLTSSQQRSLRLIRSSTTPCAKALFTYHSGVVGDLSFRAGAIIQLQIVVDEHWLQGELNGHSGLFPAAYVQVLVPLRGPVPQCRALFDFNLRSEAGNDCLRFQKGAVFIILRKVDENWMEGKHNDSIGIFPVSFVEVNEAAATLIAGISSTPSRQDRNHHRRRQPTDSRRYQYRSQNTAGSGVGSLRQTVDPGEAGGSPSEALASPRQAVGGVPLGSPVSPIPQRLRSPTNGVDADVTQPVNPSRIHSDPHQPGESSERRPSLNSVLSAVFPQTDISPPRHVLSVTDSGQTNRTSPSQPGVSQTITTQPSSLQQSTTQDEVVGMYSDGDALVSDAAPNEPTTVVSSDVTVNVTVDVTSCISAHVEGCGLITSSALLDSSIRTVNVNSTRISSGPVQSNNRPMGTASAENSLALDTSLTPNTSLSQNTSLGMNASLGQAGSDQSSFIEGDMSQRSDRSMTDVPSRHITFDDSALDARQASARKRFRKKRTDRNDSNNEAEIVRAVYNYRSERDDELDLRRGECYTVDERCLDGWYKGTCVSSGRYGVYPGNYVTSVSAASARRSRADARRSKSRVEPTHVLQANRQHARSGSVPAESRTFNIDIPGLLAERRTNARGQVEPRQSDGEPGVGPRLVDLKRRIVDSRESNVRSQRLQNPLSVALFRRTDSRNEDNKSSASRSDSKSVVSVRSADSRRTDSRHTDSKPTDSCMGTPSRTTDGGPTDSDAPGVLQRSRRQNLMRLDVCKSESRHMDGRHTDSRQTDSRHTGIRHTDSGQTDSRHTDGRPTDSRHTDSRHTDSRNTGSKHRGGLTVVIPNDSRRTRRSRVEASEAARDDKSETRSERPQDAARDTARDAPRDNRSQRVTERWRCITAYPAQHSIELNLRVGDVIHVTRKRSDGWFKGTLERSGATGLFPSSFVERVS